MNKFEYKYSAPKKSEREEIEHIQNQYKEKDSRQTKLERLRMLDNKVKNTPVCISLILGISGILIFGLGLAMILEWKLMLWGIIVSVVGCIPMSLAYFVYKKLFKDLKNKHSNEILTISDELLNNK